MSNPINIEEFIKRSRLSQGDKYDYSKVIYKSQYEPITIICPIHGEFEQIPKSHMNGNGCRKCSYDDSRKRYTGVKKINKLDKELIISRLKNIFNYNYDSCEIEGSRNEAIIKNIICPIHGPFSKRLNNHLRLNQGCNKCGSNKSNTEEFIKKSNIVHQNKYNYSKSNYINDKKKIEMECPIHGIFNQIPSKHLSGQGCPDCYKLISSKGESFIKKFLLDNNVKFESQKIIPGTKLKFDFYIPQKNMYIEYDGIQHYEPRSRFGGEKEYLLQVNRDKLKNEYCEKNNIKLLRICYKDYKNLNSILVDNVLNENKILKFNDFLKNV
jgi:very-short-patch-repair endonuclease